MELRPRGLALAALAFLAGLPLLSSRAAEPPSGACHLVLERGDVGVWLASNNSFNTPTGQTSYDRQGLLFQLGDLAQALHQYDGFDVFAGEDSTGFERSDSTNVYWVDIVAAPGASAVMDSSQAFWLFPGGPADLCDSTWATANPPICVRTKTINPHMETGHALVTFWQGPNGWTSYAEKPANDASNRFCFTFPDSFTVDVWSANLTVATPKWKRVSGWAVGEVDSIVVRARIQPPDRDEAKTPPWIYP